MKTFYMTDTGKVRQHNEDFCSVLTNDNGDVFAVVADGMGGHRCGDVASKKSVTYFEQFWEQANIANPKEAEEWLKNSASYINAQVYQFAKEHPECEGMGTTIVAAICKNDFITIGHIGDSRCYYYSDRNLTRITEDHTLVNELVRVGEISQEDAKKHPKKNALLRALGPEQTVTIDTKSIEWEENSILFLCSDGLTNKVEPEIIAEILGLNVSLEEKGKKLINLANHFGGEDNITIILIHNSSTTQEGGGG